MECAPPSESLRRGSPRPAPSRREQVPGRPAPSLPERARTLPVPRGCRCAPGVGRLGSWRSSASCTMRPRLPHGHARVHVRERSSPCRQSALMTGSARRRAARGRPAAPAPGPGRPHPADLPGTLADASSASVFPPHRAPARSGSAELPSRHPSPDRLPTRPRSALIATAPALTALPPTPQPQSGAVDAVPAIEPRRRCRSKAHCSSVAALSVSDRRAAARARPAGPRTAAPPMRRRGSVLCRGPR